MSSAEPVEASALLTCWSCHGPVDARAPFCATCGAVQAPGSADAFDRMGFEHKFDIDLAALDRSYFDLQGRLHPDRFANKSPRERALSQQQAAAINDAYHTLKFPLPRAVALLAHLGRNASANEQGTIADAALLHEMMEMREALAEVDSLGEADNVSKRAEADLTVCRRALADAFAAGNLDDAERQVTRLRYLAKFADEARLRRRALG